MSIHGGSVFPLNPVDCCFSSPVQGLQSSVQQSHFDRVTNAESVDVIESLRQNMLPLASLFIRCNALGRMLDENNTLCILKQDKGAAIAYILSLKEAHKAQVE